LEGYSIGWGEMEGFDGGGEDSWRVIKPKRKEGEVINW
jgi:hypothetical protein